MITNSKILNHYGKLNNNYEILNVDFNGKIEAGCIKAEAGDFAYQCLKKACEIKPKFIVTAPTSKEAMHLAGHRFCLGVQWHPEAYFAEDKTAANIFAAFVDACKQS